MQALATEVRVAASEILLRQDLQREDRQRILREHVVQAGDWVISDQHKVPCFEAGADRLRFAIITPGEHFTLAQWLDHMVSASANAAGSTIWKEAMLLRVFGNRYPPSPEQDTDYFRLDAPQGPGGTGSGDYQRRPACGEFGIRGVESGQLLDPCRKTEGSRRNKPPPKFYLVL